MEEPGRLLRQSRSFLGKLLFYHRAASRHQRALREWALATRGGAYSHPPKHGRVAGKLESWDIIHV